MRRLCIYLTYDPQNIADRYVVYMLKELKEAVSYLVVVSHSAYVRKEHDKLWPYADRIVYRENTGYDAGGFKDALCNYIGWEQIDTYDEIVLVNDSFFGPFQSMKDIFYSMERRKCDFWGLTCQAAHETEGRRIPEHIQTYFLAVRKRMFRSEEFRYYWENMAYYKYFNDVVLKHEIVFTQYFHNLGYGYTCLADMSPNNSSGNKNNFLQYGFLQYELIAKRNFPFFKKKPVTFDTLTLQTQENFKLALDYIRLYTDYDVDMIWENLIRTVDIADLQRNFHLNYIISCRDGASCEPDHAALIILADYAQSAEYVTGYTERLKNYLYIIKIVSHCPDVAEIYRKAGYQCSVIKNKENLQSILPELTKVSYICMIHDCDMTSDFRPGCTGKSWFFNTWHNLLADSRYINNLLAQFKNDKRLGVLTAPVPWFADYFGHTVNRWEEYYDQIKQCVQEKHISCVLSRDRMPFSVSENAWIRKDIFVKISDCGLWDKVFLPYMWSYLAQWMGYYTGIAQNEAFASMSGINQQYYMNQIIRQVRRQYGEVDTFLDLRKMIFKGKLMEFCLAHRKIYVYGTGHKAGQYLDLLPDFAACIVSDGQPRGTFPGGKRVLYLSELKRDEDTGIIVCLDEKYQEQVLPLLREKGFSYLCI